MKAKTLTLIGVVILSVFSFSSSAVARWGFMEESVVYCSPWSGPGIECIEGNTWCIEENCL